jgi:hypothetical protein
MRNLDPSDPVVNSAVFGKQVEDFIRSEIGAYLLKKCEEEEEAASEKLITEAHLMSIKEILAEQAVITRARSFRDWLAYAVQDGLQALNMLEGEQ